MLSYFYHQASTVLQYATVFLPLSNKHVSVIYLPDMQCVVASDDGMNLMTFSGGASATKEVVNGGFVDGTLLKLFPVYSIGDDDNATPKLGLGYRDVSVGYKQGGDNSVQANALVNRHTQAVTAVSLNALEPRNEHEYPTVIKHHPVDIYPHYYDILIGCHIDQMRHQNYYHLIGTYNPNTQYIECVTHIRRNNNQAMYFVIEDAIKVKHRDRYQLFSCSKTHKHPSCWNASVHWHYVNETAPHLPLFMSSIPTEI